MRSTARIITLGAPSWLALQLLGGWAAAAEEAPPLTNIAGIKTLSPEAAEKELLVRLRGVITALNPRTHDGFLQNDSGAVYLKTSDLLKEVKVGDLVEAEGKTAPGSFAPVVAPEEIRVLGRAELPTPSAATHASLADGRFDAERVWIEARVVGIIASEESVRLNLRLVDGPAIALLLSRPESELPARLRGATVRLTGVSAPGHNTQRQATLARMLVTPQDRLDIPQFEAGLELPVVEADAGMVEQVLTNLVVNARDAMPKGGGITITTVSILFGESDCRMNPGRRAGRFACVAVSDTGCGMNAETLKHMFEPFFTTKEVGKGTGLGLAAVHGIVAEHRGWVEVESAEGQGTTFRVYLPASPATLPSNAQKTEASSLPRGTGTILLVEDEDGVRQALGSALRRLGYRVQEAASGEEAIGLWPTVGDQVDLLLTDMVMPGCITGRQLAEQLRGLKPGLRVIISSGYNTEMANAGQAAEPDVAYLPKPYELGEMAKLLRRCLAGAADAPAQEGAVGDARPPIELLNREWSPEARRLTPAHTSPGRS